MSDKPKIIVLPPLNDVTLHYLSDGWNTRRNRHTAEAKRLRDLSFAAIEAATGATDAIRRLEEAGFDVRIAGDHEFDLDRN